MTDIRSAAWDTYSQSKPQRRQTNAKGETTWFNWTQHPDHGPGAEVLSLPSGGRVLDLGCGSGGNVAHLATLGMEAVGIDLSPAQLAKARERWPDIEARRSVRHVPAARRGGLLRLSGVLHPTGARWSTDTWTSPWM
ncbi:class I SAM-dependent methyltransferase [Streptomyces sp. NPDC090022]|uniref:class I SAM-dependent methyltransferase n=1 Tax=Streptomyces sp. NPDC090022 TaxID=3365920 RepID=UPI0037F3A9F3